MTDFSGSTRKAIAVLAVICVTFFGYQLATDNSGHSNGLSTASNKEQQISAESVLSVSRNRINFGAVTIGKLALESVTLTNSSTEQALTVDDVFITGSEFPQYFLNQKAPLVISAQQSVKIDITFLAERAAIASGKLSIVTQDHVTLIELIGAGARPDNEPPIAAANPVGVQAWTTISDIKNPRFESSMVQYRDDLFVFNGFGVGIDVEPTVEKFDAGTQKWSVIGKSSINQGTAVTHNGVIRNGNEVWMLGGRVGDHPGAVTSKVWKYNLNTNKWSAGPQLPVPVAAGGAALINNRVHWFGGLDAKAQCDVSNHYVYDLGNPSEGWTDISSVAPMPVPRNHFATIVYGGLIYAIGGQFTHGGCGAGTPDSNLVHAFNPKTNTWTQKASLPAIQSHTEPSSFVHKDAIYVVGGATKGNKVYRYDPSQDDWDTVAILPQELLAPIARVIDNQLIVSSGGAPSIVPSEVTYVTDMAPLLLSGTGNTDNFADDETDNSVEPDDIVPTDNDTDSVDPAPTVDPTPTETSMELSPDAGLVVLEAEYHDSLTGTDTHQWVLTNQNGASNNVAMVTTPDNNTTAKGSQGSPSIGYFAHFDRPGTWYLWLRGLGDTVNGEGSSDSVHAGLNGSLSATADQIDNFPPHWNWTSSTRDNVRASVNIPSTGIHAFNLWMREDGLAIDKILLTTDPNYTPSGIGPSVSTDNASVNQQVANDDNASGNSTQVAAVNAGTICVDTDPVGDGWGWDGSASCRVPPAPSANQSNEETSNNPTVTTVAGQSNNGATTAQVESDTTQATESTSGNVSKNTGSASQGDNSGGGALDLLLLLSMLSGWIVKTTASRRFTPNLS